MAEPCNRQFRLDLIFQKQARFVPGLEAVGIWDNRNLIGHCFDYRGCLKAKAAIPLSTVSPTNRCNKLSERLRWGSIEEGFSWPFVELSGDGVEACMAGCLDIPNGRTPPTPR